MRKLLILLTIAFSLFGQIPASNYITTYTGNGTLTIQQPATNASQVQFQTAWFSCASAQTVTLSWNATGATATAGTARPLPPFLRPATAKVFTASNISGGTTGPVYNVLAGVDYPVSLSNLMMGTTGINTNLNFTPNGTCTINVTWQEN